MRERTGRPSTSLRVNLLLLLFLASGVSGLVYEIVWVRWLTLLTGTTQQAVSAVLAIFFTGLALGSFMAGRLSEGLKRPVLLYGLIETLVGLWALASPLFILFLDSLAVSRANLLFGATAFLLPPTILLGATFPLLVRALGREYVAFLYGLNTFGAVLGVLAAGFFFPPILGLSQTVRIVGVLSFGVGLLAAFIGLAGPVARSSQPMSSLSAAGTRRDPLRSRHPQFTPKLILLVLFIGGFAALALEVLWTKILTLLMGGSIYTFSTVLVVYLIGIAAGSLLVGRIKIKNPGSVFFLTQAGIGTGVIFALFFFDRLPFLLLDILAKIAQKFWLLTTIEAGIAAAIILLPTILMGVAFPLAIRLLGGEAGKDSGFAYGFNTFGGVLGSVAAGFFLIPLLGLQRSILGMGLVYLALALLILVLAFGIRRMTILALLLVAALGMLAPNWNRERLTSGVYTNARYWIENEEGSRLTFYKEGLYGTVTVQKFPDGVQILQINGKNEASSDFDADAAVILGHLPSNIHSNPKKALLVGLGGGFTLDSLTDYGFEKIDVVEIEPAVVEAAGTMGEVNGNALGDRRVNVIIEDGRRFLVATGERYDVIVSQPSNPWLTGVSNLFTKEYYQLAFKRLADGGIMASWIQLYEITSDDLKIAIRTFKEVFPEVEVWTNLAGGDLILIGGKKEIPQATLKNPIAKLEIDSKEELSGYFLLTNEEVENLAKVDTLNTDNFPILEFSSPKALYRKTAASENLELISFFRSKKEGVWRQFRDNLLSAQLNALKGDLEGSETFYKKALEADRKNRQVARLLADVMLSRAKTLEQEGKINETLVLYDEIKEIYPEGFLAFREKGELLLSQAKAGTAFHLATVNESEREFLEALNLVEYDAATHTNLGIVYGIYGDYEKSVKEFLRAIELDPRSTLAWNNLAKAYWDQGKKEEARKAWRKSLEINPNQPDIRRALQRR